MNFTPEEYAEILANKANMKPTGNLRREAPVSPIEQSPAKVSKTPVAPLLVSKKGISSKPRKVRTPRLTLKPPSETISEAQRQAAVVNVMRSLGYTVLLIGQKRQPIFCTNVVSGRKYGKMHWPITTANTAGSPDLIISHPRWAQAAMMGVEMKIPGGARRKEQLVLASQGMTVIVETVKEALEAVRHLEQQWAIIPLPGFLSYMEQTK